MLINEMKSEVCTTDAKKSVKYPTSDLDRPQQMFLHPFLAFYVTV